MRAILPYLAFWGPIALFSCGWLWLLWKDYKDDIADGAVVATTVCALGIAVLILLVISIYWGYTQLNITTPEAP